MGVGAGAMLLALGIASTPLTSSASEPGASEVLQSAERLLEEGEFERAVTQLRALTSRADLAEVTQVDGYYLLGWAYLYLGNGASARAAYQHLNHVSPAFKTPKKASPKLEWLLEQARRDNRPRSSPSAGASVRLSSASFSRLSPLGRAPRYRGPDAGRPPLPPEREVASRPAVSNIAGWTHWTENPRLP